MKRLLPLLFSISVFCLCGTIKADYFNPPNWNDCNDFTHQSWDFLTDQSANLPASPDGEPNFINFFGTPSLIYIEYTTLWQFWLWYPDYLRITTTRRGFYGGMGDTTVYFEIPNRQRGDFWQKQIWIQAVYWARNDTLDNYELTVARNSNLTDTNGVEIAYDQIEDLNEGDGAIGKFYRVTAAARLDNQPAVEYVSFKAFQYPPDDVHPYGGASMIDKVHIDTRCINLDLIEDGIINLRDFAAFANRWQSNSVETDFQPDGIINEEDMRVLFDYWLMQDASP